VIQLGSLAGQLNRYIALSNGTGPPLGEGATIPLDHTDEPVEIDQFLSALDPKTRAELRNLLHGAVRALDGRGPDIGQALQYSAHAFDQTAGLLADVTADGASLRTLVQRASQGAQALATEPANVQGTIERLGQLLDVAANRQTQIGESLRLLSPTFGATRNALSRLVASIPVFSKLAAAAGPALDALDPFARALQVTAPLTLPTVRAGLRLVEAFRDTSPELTKLLAPPLPATLHKLGQGVIGLNPVLDHLRARAPDVLGWLPLLGDATADYDGNGHGALILASLRPPTQRALTPPSCATGWLLRPFDRTPGQLACDPWLHYDKTFVGGGKLPQTFLTPAQQAPYPGEFG
jgi:phospholipid/cholesterol/gamma-HCH transport system substrate-binding protein